MVAYLQTTDTFNTFIDNFNNLVSETANTGKYIIVAQNATPQVASGNAALGGTFTISTLVVNSSANIAGTNANVSANVNLTGTNFSVVANTALSGLVTISSNTTLSGAFLNVTAGLLRVGGAANLISTLGVSGNTTLAGQLNTITGNLVVNVLSVSTNASVNGATSLANTLAVTGSALFNNAISANSSLSVQGTFVTNASTVLGGPYFFGINSITTSSTISGAGPFNDLANNVAGSANATIYRVASDTFTSVTGFHAPDATGYRQLVLVNIGDYDITLAHANTGSLANNRFLCPSNTNFVLSSQAAAFLFYDANTSVRSWRVTGGGSGSTNASALSSGTVPEARLPLANATNGGAVSTTTQSFAGNKLFTGSVNVATTFGVSGAANALSTLGVSGAVNALSTLGVTGATTLTGAANALNTLGITGAVNALSTLGVTGATTLTGAVNTISTLGVGGALNALSTLGVSGAATIANTLTASGNVSFTANLSVSGTANVLSTLGVSGNINALANLGVTGATSLSGLFTVTGNTTLANTLLGGTSAVKTMVENANISATAATGTINFRVLDQSVLYYTTNASANWTVNVSGNSTVSLNTVMTTGQSLSIAFLVPQGATAYYPTAFFVDGSSVTPKWQGGSAPTAGHINSIDSYTYTILKTGSAAYTVLASTSKFS